MGRHSFIRMSKLTDVRGRVDYISNQKRQEHLYATYSTVEPEFWKYLSEQAQHEFWKSNQSGGKCIEARELIIALPECLQSSSPDLVLQLFTEKFREQYGVQCTAALHHNKAKTNYHIHLIFADRDMLEKTQVKYASRNMYYDEQGHHVRTKKEVLDADGNLRPGCKMLPKGDPYDVRWFSGHKDVFKSKAFLSEVKEMFTDLINQCVSREEDKLTVFDPAGPYLATNKIGKNNPMADAIRADNQVKQEWNQMVDQVLIAGGTVEEVTDFKREEVVQKVAASVKEHGEEPSLLAAVILRAIDILKEFLQILMDNGGVEQAETTFPVVVGILYDREEQKGPRPDSRKEEAKFRELDGIYQKLIKANRKQFALQKQRDSVQLALDQTPNGILHRKERKALQERINGLERQIESVRSQLSMIPKQNGYESVNAVKTAYINAKIVLEEARRKQAEWDGMELPVVMKPMTQRQKVSVLKQLAEKRAEVVEQQAGNKQAKNMEI